MRNIKILDRTCVPPGALIIEQGAAGNRAYLIESGKVEVFMKNAEGEIIKITELGPGALIGEIALIDDGHRNASVRALETTTIVSISAHDFHKALKKSGSLQSRLVKTMANRVQEMMGLLAKKQAPQTADAEAPLLLDKMMMTLERISARLRK